MAKKDFHNTASESNKLPPAPEQFSRLAVRFLRRGGVRGPVVYGARISGDVAPVSDDSGAAVDGMLVAGRLPDHLAVETMSDGRGFILRDRERPQVGAVVPLRCNSWTLDGIVDGIAVQKQAFEEALSYLIEEDFIAEDEGGRLTLRHPVLDIGAEINAFDPLAAGTAQEVLDDCIERLGACEQSKIMLAAFIESRRLNHVSDDAGRDGTVVRSYKGGSFMMPSYLASEVRTSAGGWVSDQELVGFMDRVDRIFFQTIGGMLEHNYGFEAKRDARKGLVTVRHKLFGGLGFDFPDFAALPGLADIYRRRDDIGEDACIDRMNRVLEARDDILEKASIGLFLSVGEMSNDAERVFDLLQAMGGVLKKIEERQRRSAVHTSENGSYLKRYFAQRACAKGTGHDYDAEDFMTLRERLPDRFPYGRILQLPMPSRDDEQAVISYMVMKGLPGQKPIFAFGRRALADMEEACDLLIAALGDIAGERDPFVEEARVKFQDILHRHTPAEPKAVPKF